jgi:hypothetical protein
MIEMGRSHDEVIGENLVVPGSPAGRVWLKTLLSYAFGFVCLVWVFHDYDSRPVRDCRHFARIQALPDLAGDPVGRLNQ